MPNTEESINETGGVPEIEMEMEVYGMVQTPVDPTLSIPEQAADAKATGDAIEAVAADLADLAADVADLPENVLDSVYPVGSIYISTSSTEPEFPGVWTEILIPLTWNDAKNGTRSYTTGTGTGSVHFWLRTE